MSRVWTVLVGTAGAFAGMAAGKAWADRSSFCEPGLLQGNPLCLVLLLFGVVVGAVILAGVGALLGFFIDEARAPMAQAKAKEETKEPIWMWTPGEATVTGARYGLFVTMTAIAGVWLTGGLEGWVAVKQHPFGLLIVLPIVVGIGWGQYLDRRPD